MDPGGIVTIGRISGLFGTQGWVKLFSYTRPRVNIFAYPRWLVGRAGARREYRIDEHRAQGATLIARLEGIPDRDAAAGLLGSDIAILRARLPEAAGGSFYWMDLIGLEVHNRQGLRLGRVSRLEETGANDVLVVRGETEHLIPFVRDVYILAVDPAGQGITVDWHPDD